MENVMWQKTVGRLVRAVWLYSLAGLASCVSRMIGGWEWTWGTLSGGEWSSKEFLMMWTRTFDGWCALLIFLGYYMFFRGASRFVALQGDAGDKESARRVRTGSELLMAGAMLGFLPGVGWWLWLAAAVAAAVRLWQGFEGLRRSAVLRDTARVGAAVLRWCAVGSAVAVVSGMVPVIGAALEGVVLLVVFVGSLVGWGRIRRGGPQVVESGEEVLARLETDRPAWELAGWLTCVLAFWWFSAVWVLSQGVSGWLGGETEPGRFVVGQRLGLLVCLGYALWRWRRMRLGIVGGVGLLALFLQQLYFGSLAFVASAPYVLLVPGYPWTGSIVLGVEYFGWEGLLCVAGMALALCGMRLPLVLKVGIPCFYVLCFAVGALVASAPSGYVGEVGGGMYSDMYDMIGGGVLAAYVAVLCVLLRRWERRAFLPC